MLNPSYAAFALGIVVTVLNILYDHVISTLACPSMGTELRVRKPIFFFSRRNYSHYYVIE